MSWAAFALAVLVIIVIAIAVVTQGHRLRRLQFGGWVAEFDPVNRVDAPGQRGADEEPADHVGGRKELPADAASSP